MEWVDAYLASIDNEPAIRTGDLDLELLLTQAQKGNVRRRIPPYRPHCRINRTELRVFLTPFKHLMANRSHTRICLSSYFRARMQRRSSNAVSWNTNQSVNQIAFAISNAFAIHHACICFGGRHFGDEPYGERWEAPNFGEERWHSCPCYAQYSLRKHRRVTQAFVRKIQAGDTIITFNYDALVESLLWKAGKWTHRDGYGFKVGFHNVLSSKLHGKTQRALQNSPVRVLKAHGSVNWVRSVENEEVGLNYLRVLFEMPITRSYQARGDEELPDFPYLDEVILSPLYEKNYAIEPTLRFVWDEIDQALRSAAEIVVVGYSLPKGDADARARISNALAANQNCEAVSVVGPDKTEWPELLLHCKKLCIPISQKFEDWVFS